MPDATQDLPRLCVIGTSNSAGKASYAGHMERSGAFATVVNRSLGFCSSDLFAFRKQELDFRDFDLCVLEFACNDGALLLRAALDARRIAQALTDAIAETTRAGCLPVILILPHLPFMPQGGPVRRIYARTAERLGVPWFDGYTFIRRLLAAGPDDGPRDVFKDRMHISDALSAVLGRCLATLLPRLRAAPTSAETPCLTVRGPAYRFVPVAEAMPGLPVQPRATAMVSAGVAQLVGHASVALHLPEPSRITALLADFVRSRGVMRLSGTEVTALGLTTSAYTEDPVARMTLGLYPLKHPVATVSGRVRLDLLATTEADAHVGGRAMPLSPGLQPVLTCAGFVVQEPGDLQVGPRPQPVGDLASSLAPAMLAEGLLRIGPAKAEERPGKLTY